jgi:hypothetical protein
MKDIRPALKSFLLGSASLSTAVGGVRIYPVKLPQGMVSDSIVFNRISGAGVYVMEGLSGFTTQRFQIDSCSLTADGADSLANLIRDRLDGYRGDMGSGPTLVNVHGVFMIDQRDDYDDTTKLNRMSRDYAISFKEL